MAGIRQWSHKRDGWRWTRARNCGRPVRLPLVRVELAIHLHRPGLDRCRAARLPVSGQEFSSGLLVPMIEDRRQAVLLLMDADLVWCRAIPGDPTEQAMKGTSWSWGPAVVQGTSLLAPPASWLQNDNLELAYLNEAGVIRWVKLCLDDSSPRVAATCTWSKVDTGYRAAAIVRPGLVAAVTANRIEWKTPNSKHGDPGETRADLSGALAAFVSQPTGELLIVCGDGDLVRVPLPT